MFDMVVNSIKYSALMLAENLIVNANLRRNPRLRFCALAHNSQSYRPTAAAAAAGAATASSVDVASRVVFCSIV